jgi:hypothetical protein
LLGQAYGYAGQLQRPLWDFALEIDALWHAGLTNNDLRWLVCQGYVQHLVEGKAVAGECRCFREARHLRLGRRSCFVLTEAGASLVGAGCPAGKVLALHPSADRGGLRAEGPRWDGDLRALWLGHDLVKQFHQQAPNQELILAAFQEEGWPARIDDPLPPRGDRDPVQCLHDTINRLNRHQHQPLLRFHGDGSSRGVRWDVAHQDRTGGAPDRHLPPAPRRR